MARLADIAQCIFRTRVRLVERCIRGEMTCVQTTDGSKKRARDTIRCLTRSRHQRWKTCVGNTASKHSSQAHNPATSPSADPVSSRFWPWKGGCTRKASFGCMKEETDFEPCAKSASLYADRLPMESSMCVCTHQRLACLRIHG